MNITNRTYLWSFMTQIFHSSKPGHGGNCKTFEVMTSTQPLGTLDSFLVSRNSLSRKS
jgi:hypothetical protein